MPRFQIVGFIMLLSFAAHAQQAYISNPQSDTTIIPRTNWQDGKLVPTSPTQYVDKYGEFDPPVSCMVYPDSNFIRRGFGYPTAPCHQVLANNHLYEAQGGFIVIYEIDSNGILVKCGQKATHSFIRYLAHDGSYLYVSTLEGFEIFDGTNYVEPDRVGENWLGIKESPRKFSISGDSLYYYYQSNYTSYDSTKFGIINIGDRTNPRVVYTSSQMFYVLSSPPLKYQNYLIITGRRRSTPNRPDIYFLFNLADSSGQPQIIDSINSSQIFIFRLYENRLYVGYDSLKIYEFDSGHHPILRSVVGAGRIYPRKLVEYTIAQNRYIVFTANRNYIYKAIVNDLAHPEIIDSIKDTDLHGAYFMAINCQDDKCYAISPQSDTAGKPGYGIFAYDWALSNPNRRIQWLKGYAYCERVTLYGDNVAYIQTAENEIFPIDISNIDHPHVVEDAYNIAFGVDPKISGNILFDKYYYESNYYNRVSAFSLDDPFHPESLWTVSFPPDHGIVQAEIQDSLLLVSYHRGWPTDSCHLEIINMINPTNPEILCDTVLGFVARYYYMQYPKLYFIDNDWERLRVISIENPRYPVYLGNYTAGSNQTVQAIAYNNYLYAYDLVYTYIYDTNHIGPYLARFTHTGGYMDINNGMMFFCGYAESWHGVGLYGWNVANNPLALNLSAYSYFESSAYTYMQAKYPYVFLTGGPYGLSIYEYQGSSGIEENEQIPTSPTLVLSAYPNPFNEQVRFSINSIDPGGLELDIYDILGHKVWSTLDIREERTLLWHAVDESGKPLPSGVYFARLTQGENQDSRKIVLLK